MMNVADERFPLNRTSMDRQLRQREAAAPAGPGSLEGQAGQQQDMINDSHASTKVETAVPVDMLADASEKQAMIEVELEGLEHPWNWPKSKQWAVTIQSALLMFTATISSSAPTGGAREFERMLGTSELVTTLILSLFLVGYSVGPFITAPSSEAFGRRWPSIIFMALYTVMNGACAGCKSIGPLLVCRFLAGCFASGSIVSDAWRPKDRGLVMSIWSIGSFAGPSLGPIVGGFISTSSLPVYWIFIVLTILSGAMTVCIAFCLPETYVPQLLHLKAKRLRRETGDDRYFSRHSENRGNVLKNFATVLTRPFTMFFREPILILSTLYASFAYAIVYMLFPLYPIIFGQIHDLKPGVADLPFLATLGGVLAGIPVTYFYQEQYRRDLRKNGGKHAPEMRLPMAHSGGPILLIALIWLGWSGYKRSISPAAPALSGLFTGVASMLIFRSFTQYVIECYGDYSASAMAALVVFRSLFGAGLPLAVPPMVHRLGVQWTATLLAGVQLLLIPVPFLFYKYGVKIRQRSAYSTETS